MSNSAHAQKTGRDACGLTLPHRLLLAVRCALLLCVCCAGGVELGKKLADKVRSQMVASRSADGKAPINKEFNPSTTSLLNRYFTAKL